jgi:hypothetical protein
MTRRTVVWLATLPVLLAGSQLAHGLAYWWAYPEADLRASVLQATGHGYLAYAPMLLALGGAVELAVLVATAWDAARGRPARALPAWTFALVPSLTFVLQEHLERFAATGVFPWWAALDPSFWRGLVLQIPVGLLGWLIARLLLRSAQRVGRRLGVGRIPAAPARALCLVRIPNEPDHLPRFSPASTFAGRGPPCAVV